MTQCNKENKFTCDWIFNILVVLSDGKVVCGCADPRGERPLGHLKDNSIYQIWNSDKVKQIRRELNEGHSCFCDDCGLKRPLAENEPVPFNHEHMDVLPRIFLEPTVLCNLKCFKAVCNPETGILKTRGRKISPSMNSKTLWTKSAPNLSASIFSTTATPSFTPRPSK